MGDVAAGIDVGTSRVKLRVYDDKGRVSYSVSTPSPLRWSRGEALHDPKGLREILMGLLGAARRRGVEAVGVSLYRASVARWAPGGGASSPVVLWLDRRRHLEAWRRLPRAARAAARVPPYDRVFSPYSPLPVMALLWRGAGPGERVWTVDALVHEWLGVGYVSEPTGAALTGLINPRGLRPIPLAARLAGLSGAPVPRIGESILWDRPMGVAAIVSDQQAGLLGTPCRTGGCVKLCLGTGFFADRPVSSLPLLPPRGLLPIVLYRYGGRTAYGLESLAPGAGLALEQLAGLVGGFEALNRLGPGDCGEWEGGLVLPYLGGPGAGVGPDRVMILGAPGVRPGRALACSIVVGAAATAMLLLGLHGGGVRRLYLGGGAAGIPLLRRLVAASFPGETLYCGENPAPRGAALLAGKAAGAELAPAECRSLGRGSGGYREAAGLLLELLSARRPGEADAALEELHGLIRGLL